MKTGSAPGGVSGAASDSGSHQPSPASVVLCVGPEKWLRRRVVTRLRQSSISAGFEEMDLVFFPEPPSDERMVLEALQTAPFGSLRRLVVVEGLEEIGPSSLPWLTGYCEHPNPTTCLVLCADQIDRGMKLAAVQMIPCQPLKGKMLHNWIVEQGTLLGSRVDPQAAALLMTRVGSDLQALTQALESISLFVGEKQPITAADVEAMILPSVRETAFDILDTAGSGRPEEAIALLRQALSQGQLTMEQWMGALGWYHRMVWKTTLSQTGSSSWTSPQRQKALARLTRWPKKRLQKALEQVLVADESLKLGHPATELLADQLLLELGR